MGAHKRHETCVIDEAGNCTRWSHNHDRHPLAEQQTAPSLSARVEAVLAAHTIHKSDSAANYGHWVTCRCGHQTKPCSSGSVDEQHRAHVAAQIVDEIGEAG